MFVRALPLLLLLLYSLSMPRPVPLNIRRLQEGIAFLAANKLKEGVVETASGLQYKVLKSGADGGKTPLKSTKCLCHYKGGWCDAMCCFVLCVATYHMYLV